MTEPSRVRINRVDEPRIRVRVKPRVPPLEIELQNTGTEIQWRLGTTGDWQTLVEIDDIDASVTIGTVTTLAAGQPATVTNVGTAQNVVLNFGIPAGADGTDGEDGLLASVVAGTNITVDDTDPANPIINAAGGISDGDKGDITVSGGGATLTIDNGVVTTTKMGGDVTTPGKALLTAADVAAQRTALGVGTGDSPEFNALNIGNASDTTIARSSAGVIAVEGVAVPTISSTSTLTNKTLTSPVLGGAPDASGATSFKMPVSATPTVNANGMVALDTTVADWSHGIFRAYGGEELGLLAMPIGEFAGMTDGQLVAYNATNDELEFVDQPTSGAAFWDDDVPGTTISSDIIITGLSAYRRVQFWLSTTDNTSSGSWQVYARVSGGTWRSLYSITSDTGSQPNGMVIVLDIINFNLAIDKFVNPTQGSATGGIPGSNAVGNGLARYAEIWDEIRIDPPSSYTGGQWTVMGTP